MLRSRTQCLYKRGNCFFNFCQKWTSVLSFFPLLLCSPVCITMWCDCHDKEVWLVLTDLRDRSVWLWSCACSDTPSGKPWVTLAAPCCPRGCSWPAGHRWRPCWAPAGRRGSSCWLGGTASARRTCRMRGPRTWGGEILDLIFRNMEEDVTVFLLI